MVGNLQTNLRHFNETTRETNISAIGLENIYANKSQSLKIPKKFYYNQKTNPNTNNKKMWSLLRKRKL